MYIYAAVSLYDVTYEHLFLYVAVIGGAAISFFANPNRLLSKEMKYIIYIYILAGICCIWATDINIAFKYMQKMLAVVLMCYSLQKLAKDPKTIGWLYLIWIIYYIGILLYMQYNIVVPGLDTTSERANDELLNANTVGYITFYATFAVYIFAELIDQPVIKKILKILLFAFIPLSMYLALLTASRQLLIIQIPLIGMLLLIRYYNRGRKFLFYLGGVILVLIFLFSFNGFFDGSLLQERSSGNIAEDERAILIRQAIEVGITHPFGVGVGNFGLYSLRGNFSHCSYTEIFASCGFLGAILYIVLVIQCALTQWRRYKKTGDKVFLAFTAFSLIFIIDNFFYVFYLSQWLMAFYVLVAAHSDTYFTKKYMNHVNKSNI